MSDTQTVVPADEDYTGVYGSGHPTLQEENRADAIRRVGGEQAYLKNIEDHWTVQQGPMPATGQVAALGPQVFTRDQLPDPAVARAAGVPPQQMTTAIVIDDLEEAITHPRGPEPGEVVRLAMNKATNDRMLHDAEETPQQSEHFNHTSDAMAEARRQVEEEADQKLQQETEATTQQETDEGAGDDEVKPYGEWLNEELSQELRNRELPHTGTKDEMVARLEEDDQKGE